MHVEIVDVKVMGRGVSVVEPQHHRLTDLRGDPRLVEHVALGLQRRKRGQCSLLGRTYSPTAADHEGGGWWSGERNRAPISDPREPSTYHADHGLTIK
jgi:hypothetical protein